MKIDVTERTLKFAVEIIKLSNKLPGNPSGFVIANQIVRSGTSIGANIQEAQDAISKKEFIHSMNIALKETKETNFWLEIIRQSDILEPKDLENILKEICEIIKILTTIVKKAKRNK